MKGRYCRHHTFIIRLLILTVPLCELVVVILHDGAGDVCLSFQCAVTHIHETSINNAVTIAIQFIPEALHNNHKAKMLI